MIDDVGQLLLLGVPGPVLDSQTAAIYREVQPGGFILFGRNIESPDQLRTLIDELRGLSRIEPVITIDQEGGRVSRLRLISEEPPNAAQFRERGDPGLVWRHGDLTARLLRLFGFNLDLCPVLDISFDEDADNSLRGRCYGRTAAEVISLAGAFNDGLQGGGILSCGKHFPGYSLAGQDPHHVFPLVDRSRAELEAHELAVFRHFATDGSQNKPSPAGSHSDDRRQREGSAASPVAASCGSGTIPRSATVDSLMMGHVHYASLDDQVRPASLSPVVINGLLRAEMGFQGLVMTDDLDMGAVLDVAPFDDVLALALAAGNDLLMICHRVELATQARSVLAGQPRPLLDAALARVGTFKTRLQPPHAWSRSVFDELTREIWDLRVAVLGPERALTRSTDAGSRSPVERY